MLGVAGSGASMIDFSHDVYGSFPLMLALIALATFVLLARAFRSLLLPLKAVVMNLASLGAAYGVMVWIWQHGHGRQTRSGESPPPARSRCGSRSWCSRSCSDSQWTTRCSSSPACARRYDATGDTRAAVIEGIGRTGRLVTSAALILVLSFLAMSTGPETDIKILATGLGAGILVDATLIRCLLVPALVSLFGDYNWWLPGARPLGCCEPSPHHCTPNDRHPRRGPHRGAFTDGR